MVTVYPYPIPIPSNDSITICSGENIQLYAAGGGAYLWEPQYLLDDYTSSSPVATIQDTTTFYVAVDNGFGCITNDTITINALPLPNVQFSSNSQYECQPGAIAFINETIPIEDNALYLWNFGNNLFSNIQEPVSYTHLF